MCRVSFRNFSLYVIGIDRGRLERKREKAIASYGDSVFETRVVPRLRRTIYFFDVNVVLESRCVSTREPIVRLVHDGYTAFTFFSSSFPLKGESEG